MKFILPALTTVFLLITIAGHAEKNLRFDKNDEERAALKVELLPIAKSKTLRNSSNLFIKVSDLSEDFGCAWEWPEGTSELIDSYIPFLFRTKESALLDEVSVLLNVNNNGKLIGYEMITKVDKGMEQRVGHMLRKLPKCDPIPGYPNYDAVDFVLLIKK
ncbi:hypothetical protein ACFOUP_14985 [Belliella kenyensis]|uniref:Chagasin family peptidase inhibitor I42 n=1 Tax=Belliella kenyensis TaxID=1472724 RepID=A0ABV8EQP5_9BACT|nr:hypothetical protein [Belliella kenyensis]MCH7403371.1 hypothetical protein [Belliella kenyensis]MDN3601583.1 hypothetical protein [Belliella kenyensis]